MVRHEVLIQNRKGLHARASAQIVKVAESFEAETYICYGDRRVPAESIMGLLMLGEGQGSLIMIESEGNDAEKVVQSLVQLIENKFGEDQW